MVAVMVRGEEWPSRSKVLLKTMGWSRARRRIGPLDGMVQSLSNHWKSRERNNLLLLAGVGRHRGRAWLPLLFTRMAQQLLTLHDDPTLYTNEQHTNTSAQAVQKYYNQTQKCVQQPCSAQASDTNLDQTLTRRRPPNATNAIYAPF